MYLFRNIICPMHFVLVMSWCLIKVMIDWISISIFHSWGFSHGIYCYKDDVLTSEFLIFLFYFQNKNAVIMNWHWDWQGSPNQVLYFNVWVRLTKVRLIGFLHFFRRWWFGTNEISFKFRGCSAKVLQKTKLRSI